MSSNKVIYLLSLGIIILGKITSGYPITTNTTVNDSDISQLATNMSASGREDERSIKLLNDIMASHTLPCHAIQYKQTVRHNGCGKQVIDNKLCFGSCTSLTCGLALTQRTLIAFDCPNDRKEIVSYDVIISCSCGDG